MEKVLKKKDARIAELEQEVARLSAASSSSAATAPPASIFSAAAASADEASEDDAATGDDGGDGNGGSNSSGSGGGGGYPARKKFLQFLIDTLGPESDETADEMAALAAVYADEGQPTEAASLFEQVVAIRTKALGAAHRDTLGARALLEAALAAAAEQSEEGSDSDSSSGGSSSGSEDDEGVSGEESDDEEEEAPKKEFAFGRTLQPAGQTAAPKPPRKQSAAGHAAPKTPTTKPEDIAAGSTTL